MDIFDLKGLFFDWALITIWLTIEACILWVVDEFSIFTKIRFYHNKTKIFLRKISTENEEKTVWTQQYLILI